MVGSELLLVHVSCVSHVCMFVCLCVSVCTCACAHTRMFVCVKTPCCQFLSGHSFYKRLVL